jgi:hypothetical protein
LLHCELELLVIVLLPKEPELQRLQFAQHLGFGFLQRGFSFLQRGAASALALLLLLFLAVLLLHLLLLILIIISTDAARIYIFCTNKSKHIIIVHFINRMRKLKQI